MTKTFCSPRLAAFFCLLWLCFLPNGQTQAQAPVPSVSTGSGNALRFDGVDDHVNVTLLNSMNGLSKATVECWVNLETLKGVPFAHWVNFMGPIGLPTGFYITIIGDELAVATISHYAAVTTNADLKTGRWIHIACVYDGALPTDNQKLKVYVDGFQKNIDFSNQPMPMPATLGSRATITHIGARRGNSGELIEVLQGKEDEVRVWNQALTEGQIRDKMCQRLVGNETGLIGYWRLDDGAGTTTADNQTNVPVHNGQLQNGPNWVLSGAPIGNKSVWQYPPSTLTLTDGGETLRVWNLTGSPTGLHIYSVSAGPSVVSGLPSTGANNRYFGVFTVGGNSPGYDISYDYAGNPTIVNPASCSMYKRIANDNSPWMVAGATLVPPVFFKGSETNRGEYILAKATNSQSTQTATACNNYAWNGNLYTSTGVYKDTIPNVGGCDSIMTLNLTINRATTSTETKAACKNFVWNGTNYTASGSYRDTLTNAAGCDSILILNLTVGSQLATLDNRRICEGQSYMGYTAAGTYIDTFVTIDGCDSIRTLRLAIDGLPRPDLKGARLLCNGDTLLLDPGRFDGYVWQDGSTASKYTVKAPGVYTVRVFNACGTGSDDVTVAETLCDEYFPTAFTPNRDGRNDLFRVYNPFNLKNFRLMIFNRWGEKVFETRDPALGWDGRVAGKKQSTNVFVYYCTYTKNGQGKAIKGTITLIE